MSFESPIPQDKNTLDAEPVLGEVDIAEALAEMDRDGRSISRLLDRQEVIDSVNEVSSRLTEMMARGVVEKKAA